MPEFRECSYTECDAGQKGDPKKPIYRCIKCDKEQCYFHAHAHVGKTCVTTRLPPDAVCTCFTSYRLFFSFTEGRSAIVYPLRAASHHNLYAFLFDGALGCSLRPSGGSPDPRP